MPFNFSVFIKERLIIGLYVYNGYSHSSTACDLTRLFLLISVADNFTAILLLLDIIQQNLIQLEGNLANGHGNIVVYGGRSYKVMTDHRGLIHSKYFRILVFVVYLLSN